MWIFLFGVLIVAAPVANVAEEQSGGNSRIARYNRGKDIPLLLIRPVHKSSFSSLFQNFGALAGGGSNDGQKIKATKDDLSILESILPQLGLDPAIFSVNPVNGGSNSHPQAPKKLHLLSVQTNEVFQPHNNLKLEHKPTDFQFPPDFHFPAHHDTSAYGYEKPQLNFPQYQTFNFQTQPHPENFPLHPITDHFPPQHNMPPDYNHGNQIPDKYPGFIPFPGYFDNESHQNFTLNTPERAPEPAAYVAPSLRNKQPGHNGGIDFDIIPSDEVVVGKFPSATAHVYPDFKLQDDSNNNAKYYIPQSENTASFEIKSNTEGVKFVPPQNPFENYVVGPDFKSENSYNGHNQYLPTPKYPHYTNVFKDSPYTDYQGSKDIESATFKFQSDTENYYKKFETDDYFLPKKEPTYHMYATSTTSTTAAEQHETTTTEADDDYSYTFQPDDAKSEEHSYEAPQALKLQSSHPKDFNTAFTAYDYIKNRMRTPEEKNIFNKPESYQTFSYTPGKVDFREATTHFLTKDSHLNHPLKSPFNIFKQSSAVNFRPNNVRPIVENIANDTPAPKTPLEFDDYKDYITPSSIHRSDRINSTLRNSSKGDTHSAGSQKTATKVKFSAKLTTPRTTTYKITTYKAKYSAPTTKVETTTKAFDNGADVNLLTGVACEKQCVVNTVSQEYDPVCGSDGKTYSNKGKLRCTRTCGKSDLRVRHYGGCGKTDNR